MRLSPIVIAISFALLASCAPQATRDRESASNDAVDAGAVQSAIADNRPSERDETEKASAATTQRREARQESLAADVASEAVLADLASAQAPPPAPVMSAPQVVGRSVATQESQVDTERYAALVDNAIQQVAEHPTSTFSIDVDTGSYSNVRRMLVAGERPPADAVRAEEMLNYFDYGYPAPASRAQPFRVTTESAPAPWNSRHQLLQVGIQGYRIPSTAIPAANLVFLIDTSGSMQDPDKLPLLKQAFAELVPQLRARDRVSIVAYAGSAGLVLPPTPGDQHERLLAALDQLAAGGSTNGGQGLELAYAVARQGFVRGGVNRVILATDGDFNVGTTDQKALETMVSDQRRQGVALSTLGFGTGNYNDALAEQLADLGDGNHAYIDNAAEARKVLVEEMSSTMMTIARDVKIQVEFNPAVVAEYRLIGYENRALRREDFNNDKVDAGDIGAGHDVTALYEITLVGSGGESIDPLRYSSKPRAFARVGELGWLRLRYKRPEGGNSKLVESALPRPAAGHAASERLRWSAAVAAYADLLRGGKHVGNYGWTDVRSLAAGAVGADPGGRRGEFIGLVERAQVLIQGDAPVAISE